jgi:tetratricopeptide (TPR) repeat protein
MAETGFLDLCDLARAAAARGDLDTARARFEEATALRPDSVDVRYGLATICFMLGDATAAREHFDMVQRYDPTHAGAAINLGAIANMNGDFDEAVRQLRKGISLDPKRGEAYYNLGIAYRKLGRNELAIQAYREAHHHNPRMVEAVYNLANTYYEMERYEQAAMFYRKALDINPNFRKAQEGLLRVERKMRPKSASSYDDDDEDRSWSDPFMGDTRLDRPLSPDHDFDSLARAHSATTEAKRDTEHWIKSTQALHDAVRDLAIAISSDGTEVYDCSTRVRDHLRQFRALRHKLDERREAVVRVRDAMVERG